MSEAECTKNITSPSTIAVASVCKICNEIEDTFIDKYSVEEFSTLARECINLAAANTALLHETTESVNVVLEKEFIIKWLLENCPNVNVPNQNIQNVTTECVQCSTDDQLLFYLNHYGVIINNTTNYTSNNYNSLLTAAERGTPDIISWLLEHGAPINCLGEEYKTPVEVAAKYGRLKNLIKLTSLISDPFLCLFETLLVTASNFNQYHIVKWIFENQKEVDENSRLAVLHQAIKSNHNDIVEWLVDNNFSTPTNHGKCAIHVAAETGNIVVVKWLMTKGAKLFTKDEDRKTAVHFASEYGHLELLKWLHLQGGDICERIVYGYTPLHLAASGGHLNCAKYLVHNRCDVNSKDRNGKTVLHVAAESENLELVQFLVQHGGDFSATDDCKNTILHSAVSNLDMIKWLVGNNCDPFKRNNQSKSILNLASERGLYETAKWLLEFGLSVNDLLVTCNYWFREQFNWIFFTLALDYITDINGAFEGTTLLHAATRCPDAVRFLLAHKANVNSVDSCLNTPLHFALNSNFFVSANLLLDNCADVNMVNKKGESALHCAVRCSNMSILHRIIVLVHEISLKNSWGESAMHIAVDFGNIEIVETLISSGFDVNSLNNNNESLLSFAAKRRRWDIVQLLVESGAHISMDRNILREAVSDGDIELIMWLLECGARIPVEQGEWEISILHNCSDIQSKNVKLSIIQFLVDRGVDINCRNYDGQTLLHTSTNDVRLFNYLLDKNIDVNIQSGSGMTALHYTLYNARYSFCSTDIDQTQICYMLKKLLTAGANVNVKDNIGRSPLFYALDCNNIEFSKILISYGANVESRDNEGTSVLHATSSGEIGFFLYENGANINVRDKYGVTVLQNAVMKMDVDTSEIINVVILLANRALNKVETRLNFIPNCISVFRNLKYIELLIENVIDINEVDNKGQSALHYAANNNNLQILVKLVESGANVYDITNKKENILHIAVEKRNFHVAKYIVDNFNVKSLMNVNYRSENPLHLAVKFDCIELVEDLVSYANLNLKTNEDLTALHLACKGGNLDIVKLLLSKGADIHEIGKFSYTPVQISAMYCRLQILQYLVEYAGRDSVLLSKTQANQTLMHIAVKYGKYNNVPNNIVKYLIDSKVCDIDTVDDKGNTALHYACGTFIVDVITMLVAHGANINLRNVDGNTPFHIAAGTGSIDVINFLLEKGAKPYIKNKRGNTPVQIAASHAKINPVECLLERGANLYAKNRKGVCLIHQLAISGGTHLFQYLINNFRETDVNVINNRVQTPLALAMKFPNNKNVDLLLKHQNINSQDLNGNTALHEACRYKNINFVIKLLAHDADANIQNNAGDTPIHLAARHSMPFLVEKLLPHYHQFNIKNKSGCNILHCAASGNNIETIQSLLNIIDKFENTNSGETILHIASKNKDTNVFQWLVRNCNDLVNERNNKSETVLHSCVTLAHHDVNSLEILIENNADINAENSNGDNALHLAVNYGRIDIINYLYLEKGLEVNKRNKMNNIAIHIACENGYLDVVKKLISFGSNVDRVNLQGYTCLHLAAKYGNMNVIKYLISENICDASIRDIEGKTALDLAVEYEQDVVVNWFRTRDDKTLNINNM